MEIKPRAESKHCPFCDCPATGSKHAQSCYIKHIPEIEQLRVQLAGCSVAAFGEVAHAAKIGDYGWSPAYQDVVDLRIKYDNLEEQITDKTLDVSFEDR